MRGCQDSDSGPSAFGESDASIEGSSGGIRRALAAAEIEVVVFGDATELGCSILGGAFHDETRNRPVLQSGSATGEVGAGDVREPEFGHGFEPQ